MATSEPKLSRYHAEAIRSIWDARGAKSTRWAAGTSQQSIARLFGVSQPLVGLIVRGKAWAAMPECKACAEPFERSNNFQTHCSTGCARETQKAGARARWLASNPRPCARECLHCSAHIGPERRRDAAYCSERCNSAAHQLKRAHGRLTRGGGRRRDVRRAYIIERDGGRCHLCGAQPKPADIHLDHLVPLALGGTHDEANLRVACSTCNLKKGARARNEQLLLIG